MRTWVIALIVLMLLAAVGGCSSSAPEVSAALAPATDPSGSGTRGASALNWGSPVVVDSQAPINKPGTSLAIIDGNPAVSYCVKGTQGQTTYVTLCYVRANDATGTSWGRILALDRWVLGPGGLNWTEMCVVNGNPAIGYIAGSTQEESKRDLRYVRATDSIGKKWGTPLEVDIEGDNSALASMIVVNGNPAMTYVSFGGGGNKYVRAQDQNGETWGAPAIPGPGGGTWVPLAIVGGRPAVSQVREDCGGLSFIRADDIDGNSWGSPIPVGGGAIYHVLGVVDGNPAITFSANEHYPSNVKYIRALDADGTT